MGLFSTCDSAILSTERVFLIADFNETGLKSEPQACCAVNCFEEFILKITQQTLKCMYNEDTIDMFIKHKT